MKEAQLYYKQRKEIDEAKWDECISKAINGLIYAYSYYLDGMADNWDALVLNDYEVVMPLPWRKKFGFYYLYQPAFTAQLGLFGRDINKELVEGFLQAIPGKFKLWEFPFNHKNYFELDNFKLYQRSNYVLPLNEPYEKLYSGYGENIKRNIRKSIQFGCRAITGIEINDIIELAKQQPHAAAETEFEKFKQLYHVLKRNGFAKTYGVFSGKGELLASCVFIFSHNRTYYILVGNHPNGRTLGASHALIDAFIKNHAGQNLLLDFEGSDIRNLAFFYSSFGAMEENYAAIKLNKLPWYIKWMKE